MKILIKDGASTKNTPKSSNDSFLLAIYSSYIDGIEVNLNLTKDNDIVVYHNNSIMGHPKHKFIDLTMNDIRKYNLGTKVKKHNIVTLDNLLKLFGNTNKLLILNLENHGNNNKAFVDKFINIINNYNNNNIYIKSSCKEIILYIKDRVNRANIGATITNNEQYFWNLNLDFYSISVKTNSLTSLNNNIINQLNQNHDIMLNNINNMKEYNIIKDTLGENIINKAFIITSNAINLIKK